ncbi:DUF1499 domain-containing protein [Parasphingopyxis sp.]|uniref:DUF1499 domain-containing protein n=1 Tax=Parasphingopyxis sp. TaxID=1920299 RepID=UPI002634DC83|nr:DUF1499 domain-containing protein [Parasphingopyxis sp.]
MKYLLYGVVALVVLAVGALFYLGQTSQNGEAPGLIDGQLAPCPSSPNCVSSEAGATGEQQVDPLPVGAWDALPGAIADMEGTITSQDETYLAAEFTASIFSFVDDVEFRLAEDGVHVRSASRVGYSDMGVNSERIAEIRENLDG